MENETIGIIDLLKLFFSTAKKTEKQPATESFYDNEFDRMMSETIDSDDIDDIDYEDIIY